MTQLLHLSKIKIDLDIRLSGDDNDGKSPLEVTRLGPFLQAHTSRQLLASKSTSTRIAILDDGIDQISPIWAEISKRRHDASTTGASFVVDSEGNERPWWLSRTSHCMQLAGIITELDPFCELFIAKVMVRRDKVDLYRVISVRKYLFYEI
jgi:hypothetical protein